MVFWAIVTILYNSQTMPETQAGLTQQFNTLNKQYKQARDNGDTEKMNIILDQMNVVTSKMEGKGVLVTTSSAESKSPPPGCLPAFILAPLLFLSNLTGESTRTTSVYPNLPPAPVSGQEQPSGQSAGSQTAPSQGAQAVFQYSPISLPPPAEL